MMFSPKNSRSPYAPPSRFPYAQWGIVVLICFLSAAFPLYRTGLNIVTNTYKHGTLALLEGQVPYRVVFPGSDWYSYSPLFAVLYAPLTFLSDKLHALVWLFLNVAIFWAGVFCWFKFRRGQSALFWFAFALTSAELNISVLYQQTNALLAGGSLMALAWLRDGKPLPAGILLALVTEVKPLAILFAIGVLARPQLKLIWGFAIGAMVAFVLPAFVVGLETNFTLHARYVLEIFDSARMHRPEQLDLANVWKLFGWGASGQFIRWFVFVVSILLMAMGRWQETKDPLWFSVGALALLLVSTRAESPTYVLMAPAYLAVAASLLLETPSPARRAKQVWFILSAFFLTLGFTDLWPRASWNPWILSPKFKALGGLSFWSLATLQLSLVLLTPGQSVWSPRRREGLAPHG